ncbi:MAG: hypothetical protein CMG60_00750 [Candidatus Marinimicrobia bacterium]|nr:hypothetical protein [Candidatus Neomarinimicrobiota bacterium]|tara:strand:- start:10685 stop:11893 length:1209 start_codon:yes stop_codon:yes gene_type:complete
MKIAFIGNQNNNNFSMVRYLRDFGYDIDLLLTDNEQTHFHPSCDSYDLKYMSYVKKVNWGKLTKFLSTSKDVIKRDTMPYDILIGTGLAPAYLHRVGLYLDIFSPYGDDIWRFTQFNLCSPNKLPHVWAASTFQRAGLSKIKILHAVKLEIRYEQQLKKFCNNSIRWFDSYPMVYDSQYYKKNIDDLSKMTHWGHIFANIRNETDLLMIFSARSNIYKPGEMNSKGIDIAILGFKKFSDDTNIDARLVLFEYGDDIQIVKKMVVELGLSKKVIWLPKMYRKDLIIGLQYADICFGQFGISWAVNGTLVECASIGKPIITWRDPKQYDEIESELFPILNANTPEEIAFCINSYVQNKEKYSRIGKKCKIWYKEKVVKKVATKYVDYFESKEIEISKKSKNEIK